MRRVGRWARRRARWERGGVRIHNDPSVRRGPQPRPAPPVTRPPRARVDGFLRSGRRGSRRRRGRCGLVRVDRDRRSSSRAVATLLRVALTRRLTFVVVALCWSRSGRSGPNTRGTVSRRIDLGPFAGWVRLVDDPRPYPVGDPRRLRDRGRAIRDVVARTRPAAAHRHLERWRLGLGRRRPRRARTGSRTPGGVAARRRRLRRRVGRRRSGRRAGGAGIESSPHDDRARRVGDSRTLRSAVPWSRDR